MPLKNSWLTVVFWLSLAGISVISVTFGGLYLYLSPKLPDVETLRDVRLQTPLRVYSSDGLLIGEFGEQRRQPIRYEDTPELFIQALLSAEDDRFFEHGGVSIRGLLRAASQLLQSGQIQGGGSTITMQLARDFFLTRRQTFTRKFNEILLTLHIEKQFSKEEIIELFNNKMFFGNRAYGIQAAAQVYYGQDIRDLDVEHFAMIVGVLKAPSAFNPLANPRRAMIRRDWILGRMLTLGYIDQETHDRAVATPNTARYHGLTLDLYAPYVAEMARREALDRFGDDAYNDGYLVYTTVDSRLQSRAQQAVVDGLLTYDRRHGYRGPEQTLDLPQDDDYSDWLRSLISLPAYGGLLPAAVMSVDERSAELLLANGEQITLEWDQGLSAARRYINENSRGPAPQNAEDVLTPGDVVRLSVADDGRWHLSQVPAVQGAMVALDPNNGAIRSMVGGFDFRQSHFNRVSQATRQPGSSFKPFIYAAALDNGFTPASIVNDAPIVIEDASLEGAWRPENDGGIFYGPTRLRQALYRSRNIVSIRVLRDIGMFNAQSALERFGFDVERMPRDLTLALGSHALTPLQIASGYAVIANGGYRVEPHIVQRIEHVRDGVVYEAKPATVCRNCDAKPQSEEETPEEEESPQLIPATPARLTILSEQAGFNPGGKPLSAPEPLPQAERVFDPRTMYILDSMLKDVIVRGTGRRARVLERADIAGKTGTTNGPRDAWFGGYSPDMVTVSWVGFDQNTSLGRGEYGGVAALPIWIDFMAEALAGKPENHMPQPDGIVTVRINPETGRRARPGDSNAIFEIFRAEDAPPLESGSSGEDDRSDSDRLPDELF